MRVEHPAASHLLAVASVASRLNRRDRRFCGGHLGSSSGLMSSASPRGTSTQLFDCRSCSSRTGQWLIGI